MVVPSPILVMVAIAVSVSGFTACGSTPPRPSSPESGCSRLLPLVERVADEHGLDWTVLAAITTVESRWHPGARSRAGAVGLMQVMPSTARRLGCASGSDLYEPRNNLTCGARLLARLLKRYEGQLPYALAAYAAGPRDPDRAFASRSPPPRQRFIGRVTGLAADFSRRGCLAVPR